MEQEFEMLEPIIGKMADLPPPSQLLPMYKTAADETTLCYDSSFISRTS